MDWPADTQNALIRTYGQPDRNGDALPDSGWMREMLVPLAPPWAMRAAWDPRQPVSHITIHRHCAPSLGRVLAALWVAHDRDQRRIEASRLHLFGGAFAFRRARGLARLSTHAFGAAIDLDPARNGLGRRWAPGCGMMAEATVAAFEAEGWVWGGRWSRPDAMHFQAART